MGPVARDTSSWEDRPFYWAAIKASGEPALDVGCGTGRLLLDFLARGIDIDGVDNSPEMLELCRQKAHRLGLRPALFQQPMEDLRLPRAYRTILVPSSSFQLVTERAAAAEAMHRFFRHLEPGGSLVMPFMDFMLLWQGQTDQARVSTEWDIRAEATRPDDGAVVRRWSRSTFDVAGQLEHTEDRYEVLRGGEVVETDHQVRSPATRWYTQPQVVELYTAAGFADVRLVRGFTDVPATEADTIFSAFGRHPVRKPRGRIDRTDGLLETSQTRYSAPRCSALVKVRRRLERGSGPAEGMGGRCIAPPARTGLWS